MTKPSLRSAQRAEGADSKAVTNVPMQPQPPPTTDPTALPKLIGTPARRALTLFAAAWIVYAALAGNAGLYTLQHAGVESLVERGTLYVDNSPTEKFKKLGDTFLHDGRPYPLKAPGQFLIGALAYLPAHWIVRYSDNYQLASRLVVVLSVCVFAAGGVAMCFAGVERLTGSPRAALLCSLALGFGTHFLPYAGVLHHDVFATSLLAAAWGAIVLAAGTRGRRSLAWAIGSGVSAGLACTMSFLAALVLLAFPAYVAMKLGTRRLLTWLGCAVVGLGPMLIVHTVYFGSPLATPQGVADTEDVQALQFSAARLMFYFVDPGRSLFVYSPICILAVLGLPAFARRHGPEAILIVSAAVFLLAYICSIETRGHAQWGPRYLLPIMPFLSLGLAPYCTGNRIWRLDARPIVLLAIVPALIVSFGFNMLGVLTTVMYPLEAHALQEAFARLLDGPRF